MKETLFIILSPLLFLALYFEGLLILLVLIPWFKNRGPVPEGYEILYTDGRWAWRGKNTPDAPLYSYRYRYLAMKRIKQCIQFDEQRKRESARDWKPEPSPRKQN